MMSFLFASPCGVFRQDKASQEEIKNVRYATDRSYHGDGSHAIGQNNSYLTSAHEDKAHPPHRQVEVRHIAGIGFMSISLYN